VDVSWGGGSCSDYTLAVRVQVAGFSLPADDRVKKKISDLVDDGVYSVAEMRRHITHYVRSELFDGRDLPAATDRRYFPTSVDFRNYIYRARTAKLHSTIDQVNLQANIDNWRQASPTDLFHFRHYVSDDNVCDTAAQNTGVDDYDDDDSDVPLTSAQSRKGLLFCHQTQWQQHLLCRYGHEVCLLDTTYKTSRYALPLFFVCVRTNVNYSVVASFIVQSEDSFCIAEALQILQDWNPDWHPGHWMVDFSEAEINALESVFKGNAFCLSTIQYLLLQVLLFFTLLLWCGAQSPTGGPCVAYS